MKNQEVKYPKIKINLTGSDGNAFAILGACLSQMRKAGLNADIRQQFSQEATSGTYENMLQTVMKWFSVE